MTAGLAESNGRLLLGLRLTLPVGCLLNKLGQKHHPLYFLTPEGLREYLFILTHQDQKGNWQIHP